MITHAKVGDRKFRKEIPGKDGTEMGGSRELQWCPCLCLKSSSHGGLPSFQYLGHLWTVSKAGHLCTSSPGAEGESTHFLLLYHQGLSPETTACSTITLLPWTSQAAEVSPSLMPSSLIQAWPHPCPQSSWFTSWLMLLNNLSNDHLLKNATPLIRAHRYFHFKKLWGESSASLREVYEYLWSAYMVWLF